MNSKVPVRQCVACREMKEKKELIRVIKTADNMVVLDLTGKMNGRGAYLCKEEKCFMRAKKAKALERSLKLQIPAEVYDSLEKEFAKD